MRSGRAAEMSHLVQVPQTFERYLRAEGKIPEYICNELGPPWDFSIYRIDLSKKI